MCYTVVLHRNYATNMIVTTWVFKSYVRLKRGCLYISLIPKHVTLDKWTFVCYYYITARQNKLNMFICPTMQWVINPTTLFFIWAVWCMHRRGIQIPIHMILIIRRNLLLFKVVCIGIFLFYFVCCSVITITNNKTIGVNGWTK